jgi:hypothetical protein
MDASAELHYFGMNLEKIKALVPLLSHLVFRPKLIAFLYVCQDQFSHKATNSGINSITSVYYIVSYYKNLLQVQKGLSSETLGHLHVARWCLFRCLVLSELVISFCNKI